MTYADIAAELLARFPALREPIRREQARWEPDPVGGDILLADLFVPFLVVAFEGLPSTRATVDAGVAFIEDLATSEDELVHNDATRISVLGALEEYPQLEEWSLYLGPAARALLPTGGV